MMSTCQAVWHDRYHRIYPSMYKLHSGLMCYTLLSRKVRDL